MKKVISFFVLFLLFFILTAQDAEKKYAQSGSEKPVCECDPAPKEEKPAKIFYQPSIGLGIGASIFSFRVDNDLEFLLKQLSDGTNVYMGLEIDFRYTPHLGNHSIYEIPLQVNFLFDFPVSHRIIKHIAFWLSGGVDLAIGYLFYYNYGQDFYSTHNNKERDSLFRARVAWGLGANMLLDKNVTLKLGFDSFYGMYPDVVFAVGYRF
ncbi:hypothetical protein II898_01100 [bacterium]|nr:hypothetical protein [bacterium]